MCANILCAISLLLIAKVFLVAAEYESSDGAPISPELEECLKSSGVKMEDILSKKAWEDARCLHKCVLEKFEVLKDGDLYPDKLDDYVASLKTVDHTNNLSELKNCLRGLGKVVECNDMEEIWECFDRFH
ncbi:hypothetical protein JTB14_024209 [Gonioctena quinquepunctata]|nr:hypothetical protein JTB14_024209 [Gonioctena quinquepunctata]